MKHIIFLRHHHILDAPNPKADALKKHGAHVEMVNVIHWYSKIKPIILNRISTLMNVARGIRRHARQNREAVIVADQHHIGFACALAGLPCHTLIITDPQRYMNRVLWIIVLHGLLLNRNSRIYFLHKTLADECIKPLWGRKRIGVIEEPTPRLPLLPLHFKKDKPLDAVFIGRVAGLDGGKNLSGMRRLLEKTGFPFARIRIIGDGPDLEAVRREYHASLLASRHEIEFTGWQKNPWKIIDRPSVMFMNSRFEGGPGVMQEAFASGVPVISTVPSVGTRFFLLADGRGLDLAGMDEEAAAKAARAFLNDPAALNECRNHARAWIEERQKRDYGAYIHDRLMGDGEDGD